MVSIVTGAGAGLLNSSKDVLGSAGELGSSGLGQAGEQVTVNAANGNLVVQRRDEFLVGTGPDIELLRTYNSQGAWDGDNNDNWRLSYYRRVSGLVGNVNTAGSTVLRLDADGHESTYTYDSVRGLYWTAEGAGNVDTLAFDAADSSWTWTDGDTGTAELYKTADGGASHRLTQIVSVNGSAVHVSYGTAGSLNGLITSISSLASGAQAGQDPYWTVSLNYDANRRLTDVSSTSGSSVDGRLANRKLTRYVYDGTTGRLSDVITDLSPDGATASDGKVYGVHYDYDANGRLKTLSQTDGSRISVLYDDNGCVKTVTDEANRSTHFSYDRAARTTTVTDALTQVTTLSYTARGQLEEISGAMTGGVSFKQHYSYNGADDLLSSTNAHGETSTYFYSEPGQCYRRVDAAGNVVERSYGGFLLESETVYSAADPDGTDGTGLPGGARKTQFIYNPAQRSKRQLAYVVGPQGEITRNLYDAHGNLVRQVRYTALKPGLESFAALESWASSAEGLAADAEVVDYGYDHRGQLSSESRYTQLALTGGTVSDAAIIRTHYTYDAYGRLTSSLEKSGYGKWYLYDGLNRVIQTSFGNEPPAEGGGAGGSLVSLSTYDDAQRKTTVRLANGQATVEFFDARGLLLSREVLGAVSGSSQGITRYVYDSLGRLARVQDATGVQQWMLYDSAGRKTADIVGNGQLTEHVYDGAGRLLQSVVYANLLTGSQLGLLADAAGQPVPVAVADLRPAADTSNDRITTQHYDRAGRLVGVTDAEGYLTETFYDGTGAVTGQTRYANSSGVFRYSTAAGSTLSKAQVPAFARPPADAMDRTTRKLYDGSGRLAATVDGEGGFVLYGHDAAGRLRTQLRSSTVLSDAQRKEATLEQLRLLPLSKDDELSQWLYDQAGQKIAQVDGDGYLTEYRYDAAGRLKDTLRYPNVAFAPLQQVDGKVAMRLLTRDEISLPASSVKWSTSGVDVVGTGARKAIGSTGWDASFSSGQGIVGGAVVSFSPSQTDRNLMIGLSTDPVPGGQYQNIDWAFFCEPAGRLHVYENGVYKGQVGSYAVGDKLSVSYDGQRIAYIQNGVVLRSVTTSISQALFADGAFHGWGAAVSDLQWEPSQPALPAYATEQLSPSGLGLGPDDGSAWKTDGQSGWTAGFTSTQGYIGSAAVSFRAEQSNAFLMVGLKTNPTAGYGSDSLDWSMYLNGDGVLRATVKGNPVTIGSYAAGDLLSVSYDGATVRYLKNGDVLHSLAATASGPIYAGSTFYTPGGKVSKLQFAPMVAAAAGAGLGSRVASTGLSITGDSAWKVDQSSVWSAGFTSKQGYTGGAAVSFRADQSSALLMVGLKTNPAAGYDSGSLAWAIYLGSGGSLRATANGNPTSIGTYQAGDILAVSYDGSTVRYLKNGQVLHSVSASGSGPVYAGSTFYTPGGKVSDLLFSPSMGEGNSLLRQALGTALRTSRSYNVHGQLEQEVQVDGSVTAYGYDGLGRLTSTTQAKGRAEEREQLVGYDEWGRQSSTQTKGDVAGTKVDYDTAGRKIRVLDARGNATLFYYDEQGRLRCTLRQDPLLGAEVSETLYNSFGEVSQTVQHSRRLGVADSAGLVGGPMTAALAAKIAALNDTATDRRVAYRYNRRSQIQEAVDALGYVTTSAYNQFGELATLVSDVDADRNAAGARRLTTATEYDRRGLQVKRTRSGGALSVSTLSRHDALGRLARVTDELNQTTLYRYEHAHAGGGRRVVISDPAGTSITSYDAFDRVLTHTDRGGSTTSHLHDAVGRKLTIRTAFGIQTETEYDSLGQTIKVTDGTGATTSYQYDRHGQLTRMTDATGLVTQNDYDQVGNLVESVVGLKAGADGSLQGTGSELRTRYSFDAANRLLLKTVDPDGLALQTSYTYDGLGQKIRIADAGGVTTQRFDAAGNLAEIVVDDVDGGLKLRTSYAYDAQGRVLSVTEGAGTPEARRTDYAYDELGRRVAQTVDPLGLKLRTEYVLDAAGRVVRQTDAAAGVTAYRHDGAGRLQYAVDASGSVLRNYMDAEGRVVGTRRYATLLATDWATLGAEALDAALAALPQSAADVVSSKLYDADGRLRYVVDAAGGVVERQYDGAGRVVLTRHYANAVAVGAEPLTQGALLGMLVPDSTRDQVQRQSFDTAGRLCFTVDAEGGVTETRYDAAGRISGTVQYAERIDSRAPEAKSATEAAQDLKSQLKPHAADRHTRLAYDAAGRLRFEVNAEGCVVERKLDGLGRTRELIRYANAQPVLLAGAVTTEQIAQAVATDTAWVREQWAFDAAGRLQTHTDGEGGVTRYTYDAVGRLSTEAQAYGTVDQTNTRHVYDGGGRRIEVTRGHGSSLPSTTRYEYDALGNVRFEYGAQGIELAETDSAHAQAERSRLGYALLQADLKPADRLALRNAYRTERRYDALGRVTQAIDALGGVTSTQYDALGRAVMVTDARGYSSYAVYDRLGRMVQQIDAERYLTTHSYDSFGQRVQTLRLDARVQGTVVAGQAVAVLGSVAGATGAYALTNAELDRSSSRAHDRTNRVLTETDAQGLSESVLETNAFGQSLRVRNKLGAVASFAYDRLGRVLTETLPVKVRGTDGQLKDVVNEYAYDARGNRVLSIEAKGLREERRTIMRYDGADRLVLSIGMSYNAVAADGSSAGLVTPADAYRYDAAGRLAEQIRHGRLQADGVSVSGGMRSVAGYNALGLKAWEMSADRVLSSFQYNAAGEQVVQTVHANRVADTVTVLAQPVPPAVSLDARNDRTLRTRYDALGRKAEISLDALYSWDSTTSGLVISGLQAQRTVLQKNYYDAVGNLTERRDGRGNSCYEYFDGLGRRLLSLDAGGAAVAWTYERAGRVATSETRYAEMLPGTAYTRQASTRAQEDGRNVASSLQAAVTSLPVKATESNRVTEYKLDRLDRVLEQRVRDVEQDYVDATGRRTVQLADAVKQYQYNGLGAVTQVRELSAQVGTTQTWETTDIAYDGLGREIRRQRAQFLDFEGAWVRPTTDLEYDGLGRVARRLQRGKDDAVETDDRVKDYIYEGGQLVSEIDAARAITTYAYDALGHLSRQTRKDVHRSDGSKRDLVKSYEYDASGRVTVEKDLDTGVVRKTRYNAFGEVAGRGLGDGWEEFAEYSTLGKVVKTNSGDGAIKFYLYDANGNLTRELKGNGDASVNLKGMSLEEASVSRSLYSRVSYYNSRNLLTQTMDPKIDVLRDTVSMSSQYSEAWIPLWTPLNPRLQPSVQLPNALSVKAGTMRDIVQMANPPVYGDVPALIITQPGTGWGDLGEVGGGYWREAGADSSQTTLSFSLASLKGAGKKTLVYSTWRSGSLLNQPANPVLTKGRLEVTVAANGAVTVVPLPPLESDRSGAFVFLGGDVGTAPGSDVYMWVTVMSGGSVLSSTREIMRYDPSNPSRAGAAVAVEVGRYRRSDQDVDVQIHYSVMGNGATMNVRVGKDYTLGDLGSAADPRAEPVRFHIKGRNVPAARLTGTNLVNGQRVDTYLTGVWTPPTDTQAGYTTFTWDAYAVGCKGGVLQYQLNACNMGGGLLVDEFNQYIQQTGRIDMTDAASPPKLLQQVYRINAGETATVRLFQEFNAFGEVVEERDDRVYQRMWAQMGRGLTQDQVNAAKTTLSYNKLGQLIRKAEAETWVTADNGFRYRARPTTVYGYDLLGRHTTTQDANGNLSRVHHEPGAQGGEGAAAYEFDAMGGTDDSYRAGVGQGGIRRMQRDIFGDVRRITDAENRRVEQSFDAMGRLIRVTRKDVRRYDANGSFKAGVDLSDQYGYDELGQRTSYISALGVGKVSTDYDGLGRIIKTVSAQGAVTKYVYENLTVASMALASIAGASSGAFTGGWRKTTLRADGRSLVDEQDYFGHQVTHTDLSGVTTTFKFNSASQLTDQFSTPRSGQATSQKVHFDYYANGYVRAMTDLTGGTSAAYAYDSAGNRVYEAYFTVNGSGVKLNSYQVSTIVYDELNRIVSVADDAKREVILYEYDAMGNRRLVDAVYQDGAAGYLDRQTYWYAYDAMNRFTVTKGQLSSTASSGDSTRFIKAPRGTSLADKSVSVVAGQEGTVVGYDRNSQRLGAVYTYGGKQIIESYEYSDDGYLQNTRQGGVLMSVREIDAVGRTVVFDDYSAGAGKKQVTTSQYDLDNRLLLQNFEDQADSKRNYASKYTYFNAVNAQPSNPYPSDVTSSSGGFGALAMQVVNSTQGWVSTTKYQYEYWDDAKQKVIAKSSASGDGSTTFDYDVNGQIRSNYDWVAKATNTYVTTANGLILSRQRRADTGRTTNHYFYYADGNRIGDVGDTPDEITRVSYAEQLAQKEAHRVGKTGRTYERYTMRTVEADIGTGNGKLSQTSDSEDTQGSGQREYRTVKSYASTADFDQNFEPINENYPGAAAFTYTVQRDAETLYSVAQGLWGDQSMWYLIAEVNGLSASSALKAGQLLVIPNKVTNIHNNARTWRPYKAGEAIGKTDPTLPTPPPPRSGGCGGIGTLLMVVVAVVATVYTAGVMSAAAGSSFSATMSAGASALTGGALGGGAAAGALTSSLGAFGAQIAVGATAAAVGSIASQGFGLAIGQVDSFSWRAVGQAALGGGITAGVGAGLDKLSYLTQGNGWAAAGRAAISSGVNMALRGDWNWQTVMISAVSAGVGSAVGSAMRNTDIGSAMGGLGTRFAGGLAAGVLSTAFMGGNRRSYETVFASSLGNALGESLASPSIKTLGDGSSMDVKPFQAEPIGKLSPLNSQGLESLQLPNLEVQDNRSLLNAMERGMDPSRYTSVEGASLVARSGDSISRMLGTSSPQAIGNFMRANNLTSDHIEAGRNYFVPSSLTAYGESAGLGQFALDQGNGRVAAAQKASDGMRVGPTIERARALGIYSGDAEVLAAAAANRARLDSGPQLSAITPEMAAAARATEVRRESLLNFLNGQGNMALGGVAAAGVMIGTRDVVLASQATDAMGPIDSLMAPMGGGSASRLGRVRGSRPIDYGKVYEADVRGLYGDVPFQQRTYTALVNGERVRGVADNVTMLDGMRTAVEAKYVDNWATSLRNPASPEGNRPWAVAEQQKMLEQAVKYSRAFDQAIYHTNSVDLVNHYTPLFQQAGVSNFRFVVTPPITPKP